jgi:hypothetical protein
VGILQDWGHNEDASTTFHWVIITVLMMMQCDVSLRGSQHRVSMGKIPWYVYMSSLPCSSVCLATRCGCAKSELSQVGSAAR